MTSYRHRIGHRLHVLAVCGLLGLGSAPPVAACAFHGYTPNPTLVDILLATEQVVVARPDSADPTRYATLETLAGPDVADIPLEVGREARKHLSGRPDATVLLARDGAYGPWLELAVLDTRYRALVTGVLKHQSDWAFGRDEDRLDHFAGLVNDPNPDIRDLALRELDRAPYGALQKARLPKVQNLARDLATGERDLAPIRVLLAGLSGDRGFAPGLSADLDAAIRAGTPYMGAYATALIELQGASAVDMLLVRYLRNNSLPIETREKILEGLAIQHKTGSSPTRRAIAVGVADLLRSSPELRGAAERQFGFRTHWSLGHSASGTDRAIDR
ncbi:MULTISPECIES: hypothetical protein [unclassified Roseovarius]|uniref:hypothetical protein n=1 Tax=unclassified Roseovarius TaxID=2614913 RepID=UPI00273EE377|nr:hypothetical protein [Roseovarius sp. MMSF_3350]